MDYNNIIKKLLDGVNSEALTKGDKKELQKFRQNISNFMINFMSMKDDKKSKIIKAVKNASFALIAQFPIITPVITAVLQAIFSEDIEMMLHRMEKDQKLMLEELRLAREEHKSLLEEIKLMREEAREDRKSMIEAMREDHKLMMEAMREDHKSMLKIEERIMEVLDRLEKKL